MTDGGPAFPQNDTFKHLDPANRGMSLRDWFAGMVLQGLINHVRVNDASDEQFASMAYDIADAMLKQREGG